jgi:hypothetical protein
MKTQADRAIEWAAKMKQLEGLSERERTNLVIKGYFVGLSGRHVKNEPFFGECGEAYRLGKTQGELHRFFHTEAFKTMAAAYFPDGEEGFKDYLLKWRGLKPL